MQHVMAPYVATLSVCPCEVSLKTFQFIIDSILFLLRFVDCFFKVLHSNMIILNLFFTIVVNLKFVAAFVTAFNLHTTQY